jgi:choline dehydrogenase
MSRKNLQVVTSAHTTRILFSGARLSTPRATGVEFMIRHAELGGTVEFTSSLRRAYGGEVIVCAGAFGSPQLLQLSGVGNAAELAPLGIPVVADLPGVGENLQDHLEVYVQYGSKLPVSVAPALKWRNRPGVALMWALARSGPGATNHFEGGGFARSNDTVRYPNLMFHFLPIAIRYDGTAPAGGRGPAGGHGYQVHIGPMYSDSRGTVKLTSADPFDKPALRFNYLSTETDRSVWGEAIAIARRILNQPAFDEFNAGELSPGPSVSTDAEVLDWVRRDAETALHPSCTCAMGTGPLSVTDPGSLAVHGVSGVRVVDASAMPYVTNGNIYAPTMMIAEKAADLIMGNTPLAPLDIPFYQHNSRSGSGVE